MAEDPANLASVLSAGRDLTFPEHCGASQVSVTLLVTSPQVTERVRGHQQRAAAQTGELRLRPTSLPPGALLTRPGAQNPCPCYTGHVIKGARQTLGSSNHESLCSEHLRGPPPWNRSAGRARGPCPNLGCCKSNCHSHLAGSGANRRLCRLGANSRDGLVWIATRRLDHHVNSSASRTTESGSRAGRREGQGPTVADHSPFVQ